MSDSSADAVIEYFYAGHSAYAWLGSARFMAIAAASGRRIAHKVMDLRAVIAAAGSQAFRQRTPAHKAYFFGREIRRWAEYRDVAVMDGTPTHHANDITLVNCTLIGAELAGHDIDALAHAVLGAHWRDDADLADPEQLQRIADKAGYPGAELLVHAASERTRARYADNTQEAIRRHVFGLPTYVVDGDMFYGQDRLEMVERALSRPFA